MVVAHATGLSLRSASLFTRVPRADAWAAAPTRPPPWRGRAQPPRASGPRPRRSVCRLANGPTRVPRGPLVVRCARRGGGAPAPASTAKPAAAAVARRPPPTSGAAARGGGRGDDSKETGAPQGNGCRRNPPPRRRGQTRVGRRRARAVAPTRPPGGGSSAGAPTRRLTAAAGGGLPRTHGAPCGDGGARRGHQGTRGCPLPRVWGAPVPTCRKPSRHPRPPDRPSLARPGLQRRVILPLPAHPPACAVPLPVPFAS